MEFTNKTLALLLVVTLILSMSGTLISLNRLESLSKVPSTIISGRAGSDIGNVTLIVNTTASLIFTVKAINFDSGYVNVSGGYNNCTLDSMGLITPYNCVGFTTVNQGLVLENDGNRNLSVTLQSDVNNATFIGGTLGGGPRFLWNITNNETGSCSSGLYALNGTFTPVNVTANPETVCTDMNWDVTDTFLIHVRINIPSNSLAGQRNATITATGTIAG